MLTVDVKFVKKADIPFSKITHELFSILQRSTVTKYLQSMIEIAVRRTLLKVVILHRFNRDSIIQTKLH